MPSRRGRHVAPLLVFAVVVVGWLWPMLRQIDLVVPGTGAGDNLTFVWNTWWARTSMGHGHSPFWCPVLFAPFGVDLTLHTHTALPSIAAAILSRGGSVVAATNIVIALHLFLNFAAAYGLACRLTRNAVAATLGALVFGWSPYLGAHLAGHFNLIAAWVLPLSTLLLLKALDQTDHASPIVAGLMLGAIVYVDYYYTVYAGALLALVVLDRCATLSGSRRQRARWQGGALAVLSLLLLIDLAVIGVIAATGGAVITIAGHSISMRSADNPTTLAGLLLMIGVAIAALSSFRVRFDSRRAAADARRLAVSLAVASVVTAPVLISALRLWQRGDYVTQRYLWRSAPAGIDAATLLLGNPTGLLWGTIASRAYARFGIDGTEQVAWLGPGVVALCAAAFLLRRRDPRIRAWCAIGVVFLIWALGPYLVAFGHTVRVMLPATAVRFIPIAANARIPGRAMVMVYLASAMLAAMGLGALREHGKKTLALVLAGVVILDYAPARPAFFRVDHPAIYDALARQPGGDAVCELPSGLRDGFGETGRFDSRVLLYQTIHGRAITGGFMARLPPRIVDEYARDPVLGVLLRLSEGKPLAGEHPPGATEAASLLVGSKVRYLVVNRATSPPDLLAYLQTGLPLRLVAEDDGRSLYEVVTPATSGSPPSPSSSRRLP